MWSEVMRKLKQEDQSKSSSKVTGKVQHSFVIDWLIFTSPQGPFGHCCGAFDHLNGTLCWLLGREALIGSSFWSSWQTWPQSPASKPTQTRRWKISFSSPNVMLTWTVSNPSDCGTACVSWPFRPFRSQQLTSYYHNWQNPTKITAKL